MNLRLSVLAALGLFVFFSTAAGQDKSPDSKKPNNRPTKITVSSEGTLERSQDGKYQARFDLGKLPCGQKLNVNLTVKNPFSELIKFTSISKKCKCSKFKPEKYYIPSNGELSASVSVGVPARSSTGNAREKVVLVNAGSNVCSLILEFELQGLLAFKEFLGMITFDSDGQTRTIDVPIVLSDPVQIQDVVCTVSDNLAGTKSEVMEADGKSIVKLTVPDSVLKKSRVRGEITIQHAATKQKDVYYLTVKDGRLAEISPNVVSFQESKDQLSASITLKMAKAISEDADVKCSLGENELTVKTERIADSLFRVQVSADESAASALQDATKESKLKWVVTQSGVTTTLLTPFVFSK